MILLFSVLLASVPGMAECIAVDGEWVTARDVGGRFSEYATVDPELRLLRAPYPGARRVVGPRTLLSVDTPFCVERQLHALPREAYVEALRKALTPEMGMDLVDFDRALTPAGHLEFLPQALPPPLIGRADEAVLWRGKLFYAEGRSVPVWVRVRLWVEAEVCVLKRDIARGGDLTVDDCKLTKTRIPPFIAMPLQDARALERTVAARRLKADEPIYQSLLAHKPDVEAGKAVEMRVINGGAQLRLPGKAVSSGRRGDSVGVTNPVNGKRLEGQVTGQGAVEVRLK